MASWREVAMELGHRMQNHANVCVIADGRGTELVDGVVITNLDRLKHDRYTCPFCQDTEAYRAYLKKVRSG